MDYQRHTSIHTGNVSLQENRMKCVFVNNRKIEIYKIKVDGGLISSSSVDKCDFMVHWDVPKQTVFYVELKGSDVAKAIKQLKSTIEQTKAKFESFSNKNCVIVCSRYPQEDSTIRRLREDLRKLGYKLHSKSRLFEYTV